MVPVPGVGQVGQGLQNTWGLEEEDEEEENDNSGEDEEVKETKMEVGQHEKEESKQGYYISFFNIKRNVHPKMKIQLPSTQIDGKYESPIQMLCNLRFLSLAHQYFLL